MGEIRIPLSPGFHAQPGETPGHLHDIYTAVPPLGGNRRVHVGTLSKAAVEAWAIAENERIQALGRLAGARTAITAGASQMTRPVTPITTERGDAEGFVLVPKQATKAMLDAAYAAHDAYEGSEGTAGWGGLGSVYKAMIAAAPASPPASVTGTEGDHRELRAVMRRLLAAKNAGGIEDAETQAQALGHAVDTCIGQIREFLAAPSHPGEADRVGLGELERLKKAAPEGPWGMHRLGSEHPLQIVGPDDMDAGDDGRSIYIPHTHLFDVADNTAAEQAAQYVLALVADHQSGHLVPASLAALGTGEGSGGASASPSGSQATPEAPLDLRPAGVDPARGWQPIATAPKGGLRLGAPLVFLWLYYPYKHEADRQKLGWWDCITNRWDHFPRLDYETQPTHWMPRPPAPCDGSGEAGETEGLDPKGDSAVTEGQAPSPLPHPQAPNTLSEVEEARALLEKEKRAYNGNPSEIVKYLHWRADLARDEPETRLDLLSRADRIEAALATLRASQEQDGEVRDV